MKQIIDFIVLSSADPRRYSLMVKGALLTVLAFLGGEFATIMGIMCDIGSYCYPVTPSLLDELRHAIDVIAQAVFFILTAIGLVQMSYGALRKAWRTFRGENLVIH